MNCVPQQKKSYTNVLGKSWYERFLALFIDALRLRILVLGKVWCYAMLVVAPKVIYSLAPGNPV
jgi:hypothetical protein